MSRNSYPITRLTLHVVKTGPLKPDNLLGLDRNSCSDLAMRALDCRFSTGVGNAGVRAISDE
jgi:hypothetical protein